MAETAVRFDQLAERLDQVTHRLDQTHAKIDQARADIAACQIVLRCRTDPLGRLIGILHHIDCRRY